MVLRTTVTSHTKLIEGWKHLDFEETDTWFGILLVEEVAPGIEQDTFELSLTVDQAIELERNLKEFVKKHIE